MTYKSNKFQILCCLIPLQYQNNYRYYRRIKQLICRFNIYQISGQQFSCVLIGSRNSEYPWIFTVLQTEREIARRFAKILEEEIQEAFFYPSDLVNTKTTIPLRVREERWIYTPDASRLGIYPPLLTSPLGDSCIINIMYCFALFLIHINHSFPESRLITFNCNVIIYTKDG